MKNCVILHEKNVEMLIIIGIGTFTKWRFMDLDNRSTNLLKCILLNDK